MICIRDNRTEFGWLSFPRHTPKFFKDLEKVAEEAPGGGKKKVIQVTIRDNVDDLPVRLID